MTAPLEPIRKMVPRWGCPSCGHTQSSSTRIREHMARCWADPANRACRTCTHHERQNAWSGDVCRVGLTLPVVARPHGEQTTLAVNCPKWAAAGQVDA